MNPLVTAESMFRQRADDPAVSSLRQDDARQSIEALHALQAMANRLAPYDFHPAPKTQSPLLLAGVEVSIHADLLVHGSQKGEDQIGAAILRMTQSDAESDTARARREDMGFYVATLGRLHVEHLAPADRKAANRLCLSIDVRHGEAFACPTSNLRRRNDLENACRFIAALWGDLQ